MLGIDQTTIGESALEADRCAPFLEIRDSIEWLVSGFSAALADTDQAPLVHRSLTHGLKSEKARAEEGLNTRDEFPPTKNRKPPREPHEETAKG